MPSELGEPEEGRFNVLLFPFVELGAGRQVCWDQTFQFVGI
jgi:hypothetical protein